MRVGLMLYTLRTECERDLAQTLRDVAALGYEGVEFWQLHGEEPGRVRGWLDELGLVAVGRHAPLEELEGDLAPLAAELDALGSDRVVLSFIEPEVAAVERIAAIARAAANAGLRLGFHNHAAELRPLAGGSNFLARLGGLPPDLLWFELDLGWGWFAGDDPAAELARAAGRCPLVHVKDFADREGPHFVPVGQGAVDYGRLLPAAVQAGVEWLLVEQDEVAGPPLEAVASSLETVRRLLEVSP